MNMLSPWCRWRPSPRSSPPSGGGARRRRRIRSARAILGAGSAVGLACHLFSNPTFYADPRAFQGGFRWLALIALLLLSAYLCPHLRASLIRARFPLLLACFALMGIAVIRASPRPRI